MLSTTSRDIDCVPPSSAAAVSLPVAAVVSKLNWIAADMSEWVQDRNSSQ